MSIHEEKRRFQEHVRGGDGPSTETDYGSPTPTLTEYRIRPDNKGTQSGTAAGKRGATMTTQSTATERERDSLYPPVEVKPDEPGDHTWTVPEVMSITVYGAAVIFNPTYRDLTRIYIGKRQRVYVQAYGAPGDPGLMYTIVITTGDAIGGGA